jgi:hypothetical protein
MISQEEEFNQLLSSGLQQVSQWGSFWKEVDPRFDVTKFSMSREVTYESLEWPEENFIEILSINFSTSRGRWDSGYLCFINPDSEVIYFKSNGMRERLLFMGPSGGFEEAVWVSPEYLMVTGFFEDEEGVTPKVWIIDPDQQVYYVFNHPFHTTQYPKTKYLKDKLDNIDF